MPDENRNDFTEIPSVRNLKISCHNCMQKLDVTSLTPFSHIACPLCGTDLIVPKWFDNYLLEEVGGNGGMAAVYRALDLALDREVAIKILKHELSNLPDRSELFLHEARTAATINHYAVVPIYTCGVCDGKTYIVMQFMSGGSLETKLRLAQGKLSVSDVAVWIRDIAEGLENARMHGIIHHDVKPGNILLDNEGNAKIGDFGLAQIVSGGTPDPFLNLTRDWLSPLYVSPEKVRTGKEGFQGDIYSLGATFYHLLTGTPPFNHSDTEELLRMRLTETPAAPRLLRPEVDEELSQLVMAMMARNPSDRPDYKTVIGTLNRNINSRSVSTVPLPSARFRAKPDPELLKELRGLSEPVSASGTAPLLYAAMLLLLLLIAVVGTVFAWKQGLFGKADEARKIEQEQRKHLDPNPEITFSLTAGDLETAEVCCRLLLDDPESDPEKRIDALFRYACIQYLAGRPDAPEAIRRYLSELRNDVAESMQESRIALFRGTALLAGEKTGVAESETPEEKAVRLSAEYLFALRNGESPDRMKNRAAEFAECMASLPDNAWIRTAWGVRLHHWQQVLEDHSGIANDVEPVFRDRIAGLKNWNVPLVIPDFRLPGGWTEIRNVEDDFEFPEEKFSPESLKQAAEKYELAGRPAPSAPAALTPEHVSAYLKKISSEEDCAAEKLRCEVMLQMKIVLSASAWKNPYPAESFALLDGTRFMKGTVYCTPVCLVCRNRRSGIEKITRLEWDQIPVSEVSNLMIYYMTCLENTADSDKGPDDYFVRFLAASYLRYALLSLWYGNYTDASEYIRNAMQLLPGREMESYVEKLFLK